MGPLIRSRWGRPDRRELLVLGIAVVLGVGLRLAYILATRGHALAGDEVEYWPLLVLALLGLALAWRQGRRRLVLAVAALALATSIVYTTDAGTRYRAPLEPLIVVLATAAAVSARREARRRRSPRGRPRPSRPRAPRSA